METITIGTKDLIYDIFKHWRSVVVAMLVGAIIFGGMYVVKNRDNGSLKNDAIESMENSLSDKDKQIVNIAVDNYNAFDNALNLQQKYIDNSIFMKLDASNVHSINVKYYIDCDKENEDVAKSILAEYFARFTSSEVLANAGKAAGYDVDSTYIKEVVIAGYAGREVVGAEKMSAFDNIFSFCVKADSKEKCEAMIKSLDEAFAKATKDMQNVYGAYKTTKIFNEYSVGIDKSVMEGQNDQLVKRNDMIQNRDNSELQVPDDLKSYYKAIIEHQQLEAGGQVVGMSVKSLIKYVIIGMVLAAMVVCVVIAVAYCLTGALRRKEDLTGAFGLTLLGDVKSDKKKLFGGIDKLIYNLFYGKGPQFTREETIRMAVAGIVVGAKKNGYENVFITGSGNDDMTKSVKKEILEGAKKAGVNVSEGASAIYDPSSLEKLADANAVVLVEGVNNSLNKEIKAEIELCKNYETSIIGVVALER